VDLARWIGSFPGWVFAHNGGKFDAHYLIDHLDLTKPIPFTKINGRIAKLPFGLAEIRDSFLILPVALKKLDKLDIDYSKLEADQRETHKAEILKYLEYDCRSLHDKISKFFEEYGRGLTLANRAFNQLATHESVAHPRTSLAYDAKFREFYYGGRVQALQPGEHHGNFVYLDINSAYPYAMLADHWYDPDYVALSELPKSGAQYCLIDFDGESRGALPFRDEKTGELSFPNRKARWKITGWEFITGIELGRISPTKIHAVYFPMGRRNFRKYVEHFWKLKAEATVNGDKIRREFAKLMLNAAYGKYALNPRHFTENCICKLGVRPPDDPENPWGDPQSNFDRGIDEYERPQKLKSSPCYNVATACSITGFVRAYLLRALNSVAVPLYCDTDSIICGAESRLPVGTDIGQWKVEANLSYAAIAGKKLYACKTTDGTWKTACKGWRATPEQIIRVTKGETVSWQNDAPAFSLGSRKLMFTKRKIQRTSVERVNF